MLRDVTSVVNGLRKTFKKGTRYSSDFAGWLPEDSYEPFERKPVTPVPNEITVHYDG